jgi:transposase
MNCTVIGLDLAKNVFQLHGVDIETGELFRRQLRRHQVAEYFANRQPCLVAMEACGSGHYWGRKFISMGHEVRLIAGQFVRPFVKSNKTDTADAHAIWEAAQRPDMKFVSLKTESNKVCWLCTGCVNNWSRCGPCRSISYEGSCTNLALIYHRGVEKE